MVLPCSLHYEQLSSGAAAAVWHSDAAIGLHQHIRGVASCSACVVHHCEQSIWRVARLGAVHEQEPKKEAAPEKMDTDASTQEGDTAAEAGSTAPVQEEPAAFEGDHAEQRDGEPMKE